MSKEDLNKNPKKQYKSVWEKNRDLKHKKRVQELLKERGGRKLTQQEERDLKAYQEEKRRKQEEEAIRQQRLAQQREESFKRQQELFLRDRDVYIQKLHDDAVSKLTDEELTSDISDITKRILKDNKWIGFDLNKLESAVINELGKRKNKALKDSYESDLYDHIVLTGETGAFVAAAKAFSDWFGNAHEKAVDGSILAKEFEAAQLRFIENAKNEYFDSILPAQKDRDNILAGMSDLYAKGDYLEIQAENNLLDQLQGYLNDEGTKQKKNTAENFIAETLRQAKKETLKKAVSASALTPTDAAASLFDLNLFSRSNKTDEELSNSYIENFGIEETKQLVENRLLDENKGLQNSLNREVNYRKKVVDFWDVDPRYREIADSGVRYTLNDPMYWKYMLSGTVGYSNSSPTAALSNTIGALSTALMMAPSGITQAIGGGLNLTQIPMSYVSSRNEAAMEAQQYVGDRILEYLNDETTTPKKYTEELFNNLKKEAKEYYQEKGYSERDINLVLNNPQRLLGDLIAGLYKTKAEEYGSSLEKAFTYGYKGAQAVFDQNVARTGSGVFYDTALNLALYGKYSGGKNIFKNAIKPITVSNTQNKISKIGKSFVHGFKNSQDPGAILGGGVLGQFVSGTVGGFSKALRENTKFGRYVDDALQASKLQYGGIRTVFGDTKFGNLLDHMKPVTDRLLDYGKTKLKSTLTEGFEEAVQKILQEDNNLAEKYGWQGVSTAEAIINDFKYGWEAFKGLSSVLGIGDSPYKNDLEFIDGFTTSFALGLVGHGEQISMAPAAAMNLVNDIRTNELLMNVPIMERESEKLRRDADAQLVKAVFSNGESMVFDRLQKMQDAGTSDTEELLSDEDYEDRRNHINRLFSRARDKKTRDILNAHCINYGTTEYATAVADMVHLEEQKEESTNAAKQANEESKSAINNHKYNRAVEQVVDEILSNSTNEQDLQQLINDTRRAAVDAEAQKILEELGKLDNREGKVYQNIMNQPENRKRLYEVGELAEQNERSIIRANVADAVRQRTILGNKLKGLLGIRKKLKSIDGLFLAIHDKTGVTILRQDAKLIEKSINQQIQELKDRFVEQSSQVFGIEFDNNISDSELLDYLNNMPGQVYENAYELLEAGIKEAYAKANIAVIQSQLDQFNDGIVRNEKGEFVYNQKQFKKAKDRSAKITSLLLQGNKEEAEKLMKVEDEWEEDKPSESFYHKRIASILKARELNVAMDTALAKLIRQDGTSKLTELYQQHQKQAESRVKDLIDIQTQEEDSYFDTPYEIVEERLPNETSTNQTQSDNANLSTETEEGVVSTAIDDNLQRKLDENRRRYQQKKDRAAAYLKKKLDEIKKRKRERRGRLNADITGGLLPEIVDRIMKATHRFLYVGKTMSYKFSEYVNDTKDMLEGAGDDTKVEDILTRLKREYIKYYSARELRGDDVANLATDPSDVEKYSIELEEVTQPIGAIEPKPSLINPIDLNKLNNKQKNVYNAILEKESNVLSDVSSYGAVITKENDTFSIYLNQSFIQNLYEKESAKLDRQEKYLKKANISDDDFREAIQKLIAGKTSFPVEEFVKLRNIENIEAAVVIYLYDLNHQEVLKLYRDAEQKVLNLLRKEYSEDLLHEFDLLEHITFEIKDWAEKANVAIIPIQQTVYGKDENGKNIAQYVSALLVYEDGKTKVLNIHTSKNSIRSNISKDDKERNKYRDELRNAEKILVNNYNINIEDYSLILPIKINENTLSVDEKYNRSLIRVSELENVKVNLQQQEELKKQKELIDGLIDLINKEIGEYNNKLSKINSSNSQFKEKSVYSLNDISGFTKDGLDNLINQMETYLNSVRDDIDQLDKLIDKLLEDNQYTFRTSNRSNNIQLSQMSFDEKFANLNEICDHLDAARSVSPITKVTTPEELKNVNVLYQLIFDAQIALDFVLLDENANTVDLTEHEALIASTIENLVENKDVFGKLGIFVINWWAKSFTKDDNTNPTKSTVVDLLGVYANQVSSWIKTLYNHLENDINNNAALQDFYGSLLNKYFKELLLNFEKVLLEYKNDDQFKRDIQQLINDGYTFIKNFNGKYGPVTDPDLQVESNSEVLVLNRQLKPWKGIDGNDRVSYAPAFDQMSNSDIWYALSLNPDFLSSLEIQPHQYVTNGRPKITLLIADRSGNVYIKNKKYDSKRPYLSYTSGELLMIIRYPRKNEEDGHVDFTFHNDASKYLNINQETRDFLDRANAANLQLADTVERMLNYVKKHPKYEFVYDVSLSNGSIRYDKNGELHSVKDFLFKSEHNKKDLFKVTISEDDGIGLTAYERNNMGQLNYPIKTGDDLSITLGQFENLSKNNDILTRSGALVFMYTYENGDKIPVVLKTKPIGDNAEKILNLIARYSRGEREIDGYNIMDLLQMVMYVYNPDNPTRTSDKNEMANRLTIFNNGKILFGNTSKNIYNDKEEVLEKIRSLGININVKQLNEKLILSNNSVLSSVRVQFQQSNDLKLVTLPNGLTFKREDFLHENGSFQGSTFLGYLLRNDYIGTNAIGLSHRDILITNPRIQQIQPESQQSEEKTLEQRKENVRKSRYGSNDSNNSTSSLFGQESESESTLFMQESEHQKAVKRSKLELDEFKKQALEYFYKVFGENFSLTFDERDKYLLDFGENLGVLGAITKEGVILSKSAPESAIWHEAFHRLIELILPNEQRDKLYSTYRKKHGEFLSDRLVAEGLADMFTDFMVNEKLLKQQYKGIKGIIKFFKRILYLWGMCLTHGFRQTYDHYFNLYKKFNSGKFANDPNLISSLISVPKDKADRFDKIFGNSLFYKVEGGRYSEEYSAISNSSLVDAVVKTLGYYIAKSYGFDLVDDSGRLRITDNIIDRLKREEAETGETVYDFLTAAGVPQGELMPPDLIFREIFEEGETEFIENEQKLIIGLRKTYPKFKPFEEKIKQYLELLYLISHYSKEDKESLEEFVSEDTGFENRSLQSQGIDKFDRSSYEYSKLDNITAKVKLFFATIPFMKFDENGKLELDYSKNQLYTPQFIPLEQIYNVLTNDKYDLTSIKNELDLLNRLHEIGEYDPMVKQVYEKFKKLVESVYTHKVDPNTGATIETETNYDNEALMINIVNTIRSQKLNFLIAVFTDNQKDGKSINIKPSSFDYDSRNFVQTWSLFLVGGMVSAISGNKDANGNYIVNEKSLDLFKNVALFLREAAINSSSNKMEFSIKNVPYTNSADGAAKLKKHILTGLHRIGIMLTSDALDYMLITQYQGLDMKAISRWLNDTRLNSMLPFLDRLYSFIDVRGNANKSNLDMGYAKLGFVGNLASWLGKYNRSTTLSMTLGLKGKTLYKISQNHSISRKVNNLNTGDPDNKEISLLLGYHYNYDNERAIGSIILKLIINKDAKTFKLHTFIGSKTNNRTDLGFEYKEEPEVNDFVSKMGLLQSGYMLFPPLSDKSTWVVLEGVDIPGIEFIKSTDKNNPEVTANNVPDVKFIDGNYYLMPDPRVTDQMIEYSILERDTIEETITALKNMPEEDKIENYHTPNKDKKTGRIVEPNGTRFLSLTKLVVPEEKDGKIKLVEYNLNNPNKSSKDLLAFADKLFFKILGLSAMDLRNRQREIMAYTLASQTNNVINKALDLGIIKKIDIEGEWQKDGKIFKRKNDKFLIAQLESTHLDNYQIRAVTAKIIKKLGWNNIKSGPEANFKQQIARSFAIAAILQDVTNRSIISSQECLRCFIGHPGQFKVLYGENEIKDSTFDLQKRLGGLVSTGEDNFLNIPGVPLTYTCAEVQDYKVSSTSEVAPHLKQMFVESQIKDTFAELVQDKAPNYFNSVDVYNLTTEEIYKKAEELEISLKIEKAKKLGEKYAESYTGGIDVADGSAYISDKMCEYLLRIRGAYNNDIKEAFELLRGDKKISWMESAEAYKKIYDTVNIVSTKYTAYGFREHRTGNKKVSNMAVAYYNKFALFPLFPCLATGPMLGIYEQMNEHNIDMLLMHSAVKLGSQSPAVFDGKRILGLLVTYTQSLENLTRQLNTDPEEEGRIAAGTQMIKITLSAVRPKKKYKLGDKDISGEDLVKKLMDNIKALSKIGLDEVKDELMDESGKNVDEEKFSRFLQRELSARNANKRLINSIQLLTNNTTKQKELKAPLEATDNSSWLESILISFINRYVIDINTVGASFVQRSVFAIEGDDNPSISLNNGKPLQMINKDGSMDAVISINYFEKMYAKELAGMSFSEKRKWLIDNDIIGDKAKTFTVGYRIPTQAPASVHALKFVDVVPAVKDTIILPKEFTKITGSDFDIDHLYLASQNLKGEDKQAECENTIIACLLAILMSTDNGINQLYKSIDNDTELVENPAKTVIDTTSTKQDPFNFGTLAEQVTRKNDYITGKFGIGPFALNSTNHALTQTFKVRFKQNEFTKAVGLNGLHSVFDIDGNTIMSWLSAFINAHVDIVKDPFISNLNVNKFTYNMLNLLVRAGWGDFSVWFCAQPIIRGISNVSELAKSEYLRDPSVHSSIYKAEEAAIQDVIKKYCPNLNIVELDTYKDPKQSKKRASVVNWCKDHKDELAAFAKDLSLTEFNGINRESAQEYVIKAWMALDIYSRGLSDLVQYTKIDTKKHGKTLLQILRYKLNYKKLIDSEKSVFNKTDLKDFVDKTWIDFKTNAAIDIVLQILQRLVFSSNPDFMRTVKKIAESVTLDDSISSLKTLHDIANHLATAIKCKYYVDYAKEELNMGNELLSGLFIGNSSVVNRLTRLKILMENNSYYARLKDNFLLQRLFSLAQEKDVIVRGVTVKPPSFVSILHNQDSSKIDEELLQDAWDDLLRDKNEHIRVFAKQLIVYAGLTSGNFKGWNKLSKYIPDTFFEGNHNTSKIQSYNDYIKEKLTTPQNYDNFISEIISNNFSNSNLVKNIPLESEETGKNFVGEIKTSKGTVIARIGKPVDLSMDVNIPQYIRVKNQNYNGTGVGTIDLFSYAGFYGNERDSYPVYVKQKKKGYSKPGVINIYEYGWEFNYGENEAASTNQFDFDNAYRLAIRFIKNHASGYLHKSEDLQNQFIKAYFNIGESSPSNVNEESNKTSVLKPQGCNMYSGGDTDSEQYFVKRLRNIGVNVKEFVGSDYMVLYREEKDKIEAWYTQACEFLGKPVIPIEEENSLFDASILTRSKMMQVETADAVFAIVEKIIKPGDVELHNNSQYKNNTSHDNVSGETAYAVARAINRRLPVYVFDQSYSKWKEYSYEDSRFIETNQPKLTYNAAVIGTTNLQDSGKTAIEKLINDSFGIVDQENENKAPLDSEFNNENEYSSEPMNNCKNN